MSWWERLTITVLALTSLVNSLATWNDRDRIEALERQVFHLATLTVCQ